MATNSKVRTGQVVSKRNQDIETSPERTKMVAIGTKAKVEQKAGVVYCLSKNGQLDQPHFMEVPLSSPQGLYLKDFVSALNSLRGQGMASMYSWSSKRRYRNGYVWQDLSGDDFIQPSHDLEYILKGSLLIEGSQSCRSFETTSSTTSKFSTEMNSSGQDSNLPLTRRRNNSWSTIDDLEEEKIYKAKTTGDFAQEGADASTQTDDNVVAKMAASKEVSMDSIEDISQPNLKDYSNAKNLGRYNNNNQVHGLEEFGYHQRGGNERSSVRMKLSLLLLKLIGCGSKGFKFNGFGARKERN